MFPVIITCQHNLHLITSWKDVGVCLAPLLVCNFTKPFPAGRYKKGEGFGYARLSLPFKDRVLIYIPELREGIVCKFLGQVDYSIAGHYYDLNFQPF